MITDGHNDLIVGDDTNWYGAERQSAVLRNLTGIRRMVNSQLPSVSVRGRSSVSAMSLRNDSGTLRV